jgi:hypothetical protein
MRWTKGPYPTQSFYDARGEVFKYLGVFQVERSTLSTNIPIPPGSARWLDKGKVRRIVAKAEASEGYDPAAALYFRVQGIDYVIACDQYVTTAQNVGGINHTLEHLGPLLRYAPLGLQHRILWSLRTDTANKQEMFAPWWEALEVSPSASTEIIKAAYKVKAKQAHPDAGGTTEQMQKINNARDKGLEARKKER